MLFNMLNNKLDATITYQFCIEDFKGSNEFLINVEGKVMSLDPSFIHRSTVGNEVLDAAPTMEAVNGNLQS